jgi:hypothetical protein
MSEVGTNQIPNNNINKTQNNLSGTESSITITNSGSTNSQGFELIVYPNGSGTLNAKPSHAVNQLSAQSFPSGTLDYDSLVKSIESVPISILESKTSCIKSTSFGFSETVGYNGIISGDVTCPAGSDVQNLETAVEDILKQANCFNSDDPSCLYA